MKGEEDMLKQFCDYCGSEVSDWKPLKTEYPSQQFANRSIVAEVAASCEHCRHKVAELRRYERRLHKAVEILVRQEKERLFSGIAGETDRKTSI